MSAHTTRSGWQLQTTAAAAYEAYLVPVIFEGLSEQLVATAGVQPGDRVLDVACGTGVVARTASRHMGGNGTIIGVDLNSDMLATARDAARGVTPTVEFREADVTRLPFDDDTFDVTLCQEALQFFPDRVAALREMARVTVPGGRVAFSVLRSLDHHPVYAILASSLGEHVGPHAAEMMGSPFILGNGDVLRDAAHDAGLEQVTVRISIGEERFPSVGEFLRWEAASSPLAATLGQLDAEATALLVAELDVALAPYLDDIGLVFANQTHIVTARPN